MTARGHPQAHSCPCGKRGYLLRSEARRVIKVMRRSNRIEPHSPRMDTYRCATSGMWHVGHRPWWRARAVEQSDDDQEAG